MDFCGNFLTLRKRGFFCGNFLGLRKGRFGWIFLTLRKRGFLDHVGFFGQEVRSVPARDVLVDFFVWVIFVECVVWVLFLW